MSVRRLSLWSLRPPVAEAARPPVVALLAGTLLASFILLGGALALAPATAKAQAWIRPPGGVYAKLSYRLIVADSFYAPDGSTRGLRNQYRQHALGLYAEAGIIERWLSVSIDGDLYRRSSLEGLAATQGLGDLRIGAYTGLLEVPFRLALGVHLGIPTGDDRPTTGYEIAPPIPPAEADQAELEQAVNSLPTGDGEWDVAIRLYLGHAFSGGERYPFHHYVAADVGWWIRTQGFSQQLVYHAELGSTPKRSGWDRLQFVIRVTGVQTFEDSISAGAGLGDGIRFLSPGLELSVRTFDQLRLGVAAEGAVFASNLPAAPNFMFFMSWQRDP